MCYGTGPDANAALLHTSMEPNDTSQTVLSIPAPQRVSGRRTENRRPAEAVQRWPSGGRRFEMEAELAVDAAVVTGLCNGRANDASGPCAAPPTVRRGPGGRTRPSESGQLSYLDEAEHQRAFSFTVEAERKRAFSSVWRRAADGSYLVDPASSHMLVSKIKPCMSKHKPLHGEAANGSLGHP